MSSDDVDAFILSFSYSSFFTKQKKTLFMIFLFMIVFKINEAIPMTKLSETEASTGGVL